MRELVIGSRGSRLAIAQAETVSADIRRAHPQAAVRIEVIRTSGDADQTTPLARMGGTGVFVREIEVALADGRIDAAVHSLKDMPTEPGPQLFVAAVPRRLDPCDVLISRAASLDDLPEGARVGTSSLRRKAQILAERPDLQFLDLRGNLDTRVRGLSEGRFDAVVVAWAGLARLGFVCTDSDGPLSPDSGCGDILLHRLSYDVCLPAPGQGALAVQVRQDDCEVAGMVAALDDAPSRAACEAERSLLAALGGGCRTPVGAVAVPDGSGGLVLKACVASPDGSEMVRVEASGPGDDASGLGRRAASVLLESGAHEILTGARDETLA